MDATVELYDPDTSGSEWDYETGTWAEGSATALYFGKARVQPIRSTSSINNNANDTFWWSIASCSTGALAKGIESDASVQPSSYQVYSLQGKLHSTSDYAPQNLPAGRWLLISRDAQGQALQSRVLEVAP